MDTSNRIGVAWSVPAERISVAEANHAISHLGLCAHPLETRHSEWTDAELAVLDSANYEDLDHLLREQKQLSKPSLIVVESPDQETQLLRQHGMPYPMEVCRSDVMCEQLADRLQRLLETVRPTSKQPGQILMGTDKAIYDREYLNIRLAREFANVRKHCRSLTIVWLVPGHLAYIAQKYGEQVRHQIVEGFAKIVLSNIRLVDWLSQYSDEEFCLVLPDTWSEEANRVMDRIRKDLTILQIHVNEHTVVTPRMSIGIAEFHDTDESHEDLMQRAAESVLLGKLLTG